jgi:hypothetical protein
MRSTSDAARSDDNADDDDDDAATTAGSAGSVGTSTLFALVSICSNSVSGNAVKQDRKSTTTEDRDTVVDKRVVRSEAEVIGGVKFDTLSKH